METRPSHKEPALVHGGCVCWELVVPGWEEPALTGRLRAFSAGGPSPIVIFVIIVIIMDQNESVSLNVCFTQIEQSANGCSLRISGHPFVVFPVPGKVN